MNKPELQPELTTAPDTAPVATSAIFEIRNITLKEAIQLVRSIATTSDTAERADSPRSK